MTDEIQQLLKTLHLKEITEIFDTELSSAETEERSYQDFIARLLGAQWHHQQESALAWRIERAKLPEQWTLESFPFKKQPGVSQKQMRGFAELDFIAKAENLVFIGPTAPVTMYITSLTLRNRTRLRATSPGIAPPKVSDILIPVDTRRTLEAFDRFLSARGLRLEAVVIGGAALNLLGIILRATKDCDVLDPLLSTPILEAARSFAADTRRRGEPLREDWLNNGPASLASLLPPGWRERLQIAFVGQAMDLRCLGREDLLRSKLFALCDRALDLPDCIALAPTADELRIISPWVEQQDANPGWPAHVRETLSDISRRLGHAV